MIMNKLFKKISISILGAALLTPVATTVVFAAPAASEQQATNNLIRQLTNIKSLTAQFEQSTQASTQAQTGQKRSLTGQHLNQSFKGEMKVQRPGKFYWQTNAPSKQTIVTTGKVVWIYDPDLQQAVRQTLDDQVANTPALLLSGNTAEIMKSYRVTQPDQGQSFYTLLPRDKDGAFQSLSIRFAANQAPSAMILKDALGQTTQVKFSNVKVNPTILASVFNFTPPKGTDIIEQ